MKALIIYDDFASAVRASTALRQAAHRPKVRANWNLRPWRADILRFTPAADEALNDAVDADVIMLAGRPVYALPPWLRQWLEYWGSRRKAEDCALVVVRDETEGKGSAPNPELSLFAQRHGLDFIVENDTSSDDEILSSVLTLPEDDWMKIKSLLVQIRPRCFARWRSLPLFGPLLDDFLRWMHDQQYTDSTLDSHLAGLRKVVVWLGRRRITTLAQLTQKDLQAAHDHFLPSQRKAGSVIGAFKRFLSERRLVSQGNWPLPSPVEVEVERFGAYLRETRGAAEKTIACRGGHLRAFLKFLRFEGKPVALRQLELRRVEAFMRELARTNSRSSMQQVPKSGSQ
jgi:hypothetical protein